MRLERDSIPLDKEFPFQISEVELNPSNSHPGTWHWHSYFEITWVLEGKGNYFVNGQEYTMEENDIIIFNNVEPHGWKLLGGRMKLLVMIFSPEFVAEKISTFDTEYLRPFVERGTNFKNRVGHEEPVNTEIRTSIQEIYQEWQERKEGYPLMIKANVLRILTMLIIPFMSCSARLPVYVLLISAFFPKGQGLVLFSIYLIGIVVAVLSSLLFKKVLFSKVEAPFVMELPPYRVPTVRNVALHMWSKGSQYLRKMGTIILAASIIIWALSYYPHNTRYSEDFDAQKSEIAASTTLTPQDKEQKIQQLNNRMHAEQQEQSYIGRFGHFIEPIIRPLGFDWQIGVSLTSGLAAKEIVVSTMAVLSNSGDDESALPENLKKQVYTHGKHAGEPVYTPLVAYSLMLFILLYVPCFATITAIRREAGSKWALFSVLYSIACAWLASFLVYQIGSLF